MPPKMTPLELAAHNRLGLFMHYLGLAPWDIGRLTVEEFHGLCEWVDAANKADSK